MKRVIRLTETDIRHMVNEALNELSLDTARSAAGKALDKARNASDEQEQDKRYGQFDKFMQYAHDEMDGKHDSRKKPGMSEPVRQQSTFNMPSSINKSQLPQRETGESDGAYWMRSWAELADKNGFDNRLTTYCEGEMMNYFVKNYRGLINNVIRGAFGEQNSRQKPTQAIRNAKNGGTFSIFDIIDGSPSSDSEHEHIFKMSDRQVDNNGNFLTDDFGQFLPTDNARELSSEQSTMFGDIDMKNHVPTDNDSPELAQVKQDFLDQITNDNRFARGTKDGKIFKHQGRKQVSTSSIDPHDIYMSWYTGESDGSVKGSFQDIKEDIVDKYFESGAEATYKFMLNSVHKYARLYYTANSESLLVNHGVGTVGGSIDNYTGENTFDDIDVDNGPTTEDFESGFDGPQDSQPIADTNDSESGEDDMLSSEDGGEDDGEDDMLSGLDDDDYSQESDIDDADLDLDLEKPSAISPNMGGGGRANAQYNFLHFIQDNYNSITKMLPGLESSDKQVLDIMIQMLDYILDNPEENVKTSQKEIYRRIGGMKATGMSEKTFNNRWAKWREYLLPMLKRMYGEQFKLSEARRRAMNKRVDAIINETLHRMLKNRLY